MKTLEEVREFLDNTTAKDRDTLIAISAYINAVYKTKKAKVLKDKKPVLRHVVTFEDAYNFINGIEPPEKELKYRYTAYDFLSTNNKYF